MWAVVLLFLQVRRAGAIPSNTVRLDRLLFCECRDIALKRYGRRAQLVQLSEMAARISKISIVSTLSMGGGVSLVSCGDSHVVVKSCDLNHLNDGFGFFTASKVTITSSTFRDSVVPIIVQDDCSERELRGAGSGIYHDTSTDLTVCNCKFIECTSRKEGESDTGAVYFGSTSGQLNLTLCYFEKCNGAGGWATAVDSQAPKFCFDYCEVVDCKSASPETTQIISIVNFATTGAFTESISLTGDVFRSCQAFNTGSGLVINNPADLAFIDCVFSDCDCIGENAAISLTQVADGYTFSFQQCVFKGITDGMLGGAIFIRTNGRLELQDVWFENCASVTGSAIYVESSLSAAIDNVTVIACEGTGGKYTPFSMVLNIEAENVEFRNLHLKDMRNGNGRLQTSFSATLKSVVLWNCSFENFLTQGIFDWDRTENKPLLEFDLNLTDCRFVELDVSKSDGGSYFIEYDEQKLNLKDLTMCRCEFESVVVKGSLIYTLPGNTKNACNLSQVTFKDTVVSEFSLWSSQVTYPLLVLSGFKDISITDVHFSDINGTDNGFLYLCKDYEADWSVEIDSVTFTNCEITRMMVSQVYEHLKCGFIRIQPKCALQTFSNCKFTSCRVTKEASQPFVYISSAVDINIVDFVVENCDSYSPVLRLDSESVILTRCRFSTVDLTWSLIRSNGCQNLRLVNTELSKITVLSEDAIISDVTEIGIEIDSVTVDGSSFRKFVETSGKISVFKGTFTDVSVSQHFLKANSPSSEFNLTSSTFTLCKCSKADSGHMITVQSSSAAFSGVVFDQCSCQSGSLIYLEGVPQIYVGDACFTGTEKGDGAAYISSTTSEATFELPLCFDLSEKESVFFNDMRPWSDISETENIFNCLVCNISLQTSDIGESEPGESESGGGEPGDGSGLGPGEIAGIVIAVLVVIAAIILILFFFVFRKRSAGDTTSEEVDQDAGAELTLETVTVTETVQWTSQSGLIGAANDAIEAFEEAWD